MDDFRLTIDDLGDTGSTDYLDLTGISDTTELELTNDPISTESRANNRKRNHLTERMCCSWLGNIKLVGMNAKLIEQICVKMSKNQN